MHLSIIYAIYINFKMTAIDRQLNRQFERYMDQPDHIEQVIVTLTADADRGELERLGMVVTSQMSHQPIVVGTINSLTLNALSKWSGVVCIELDGTDMRALDS